MAVLVHQKWLAVVLNILFLGGVWCDCSEEGMEILGGDYKITIGKHGRTLIYQCPENSYPYPVLSRVCRHTSWKDLPISQRNIRPICRLVECPDPTVLQHGTVNPFENRYYVNNETTYECDSGYQLRGSAKRFCLANGKWNGSTPICSHDDVGHRCPDPGIPPGSHRSGDRFDIDDEVKYTCPYDSMYLVGSSVRTCKESGEWSGMEPSCFYPFTYDTAADISKEFGGSMQEMLSELTSVDDILSGRKIRITKNGVLNMFIAVDISDSLEKKDVNKSIVMVDQLISKIASYSTSPNYDIVFFTSELESIANILDYYNLDQRKTLEEVLKDLKNFEIRENRPTGTDLNKVFRHIYERISLIEEIASKKEPKEDHSYVICVFTDGGYNMGGSPKDDLQRIKDTVKQEDHLDVYMFAVGRRIYEEHLKPLATEGRGRHFFIIKDTDDMASMFEDIFDDTDMVSLCGLHDTTDSSMTKQKIFPWNVAIYIQRGQKSKQCMGAIISPKFVLTAAHCFNGDLPENIQVKINREIQEVEKYYVHSQYDISAKKDIGVMEFYDYDIALIQLKDDLHFTVEVRPICLPCTKETTLALRLPLDSKCTEQEELLLKDVAQALSFLSRGEEMYQKNVNAKIDRSNREPCIEKATLLPNITQSNLHEVVTDNFLCTGGAQPTVDSIACKGDSGGAVFRDYNQRTIQVALVSWGTEDLCASGHLPRSTETSRDFHMNLFRVMDFLHKILSNNDQTEFAPIIFMEKWNL